MFGVWLGLSTLKLRLASEINGKPKTFAITLHLFLLLRSWYSFAENLKEYSTGALEWLHVMILDNQ